MKKERLDSIAQEIKRYVDVLKSQGYNKDQIRTYTLMSINKTTILAFQDVQLEVLLSPEAGFNFVFTMHEGLGGVNAVMLEEGIDPLHISEIEFLRDVLIGAMEDVSGMGINDIMADMERFRDELKKEEEQDGDNS